MSKTEENLKAAFAGESQARNKYTYFAKVARKQGYHYIANIFEETAFLKALGIQKPILKLLLKASIMKQQICIQALEKMQMQKATKKQPFFSGR